MRRALGVFLFLFVLGFGLAHLRDPDTWWHLKAGEVIWRTRSVPRADVFSYSIAGARWVDFEWLSQLLFYLAFRAGGAGALIALKAGVLAAAFVLLWSVVEEAPLAAAAAVGLAALAARDAFVERPQIFDFLFLALMLRWLWRADFARPDRRLRWTLPLLAALWANLHGGAALLAPGLLLAGAAAERLRSSRVPMKTWAATAALCAAAMLLNPNGITLFTHLAATVSFPGRRLINEWKTPFEHPGGRELYWAFVAAGAWAAWTQRLRRPFASAWCALLGAATFTAVRHIPLFLFCAAPLIAEAAGARSRRLLATPLRRGLGAAALCAVLVAAAVVDTTRARSNLIRQLGIGLDEPLAGAVAFLDRAGVQGRMFNEYGTGGYLIWKSWPERRVFVDGRNVEYGPGFVREAIDWREPAVWRGLVERWRFDYAVIKSQPEGYAAAPLDADGDWRLAYWDDNALVYLRRTPENEALIGRYGYRYLQPSRPDYTYLRPALQDPRTRPEVLAEIDRSIEQAPRCANALLLKSLVLAALGRVDEATGAAQKAVELYPRKAQPLYTLGWLYEMRRDWAKAAETYEAALERIVPGERATIGADLLNNLGALRERQGETEEARRAYERALRWNPAQRSAGANLARLSSGR